MSDFDKIGKYHISYRYPYIGKTNAIPMEISLRDVFREILETFQKRPFERVDIYEEIDERGGEWILIFSCSADEFLTMIEE